MFTLSTTRNPLFTLSTTRHPSTTVFISFTIHLFLFRRLNRLALSPVFNLIVRHLDFILMTNFVLVTRVIDDKTPRTGRHRTGDVKIDTRMKNPTLGRAAPNILIEVFTRFEQKFRSLTQVFRFFVQNFGFLRENFREGGMFQCTCITA
uniref:Uncharacterized protein n=1 Tax=Cacopsylla melanoneura TaxID=428564 RepID=A0A8D8SZ77_9HEMI